MVAVLVSQPLYLIDDFASLLVKKETLVLSSLALSPSRYIGLYGLDVGFEQYPPGEFGEGFPNEIQLRNVGRAAGGISGAKAAW